MQEAWIECVPNFSEGRRSQVIEAIVARIASVDGARVLDRSLDPDHNRAVVTFAAPSDRVGEAAFAAVEAATARIDLRRHSGVHPRMGATDVLPFVPLQGATIGRAAEVARSVGERIARELKIPVYFYGAAAEGPRAVSLPEVRRGGFEALREAIAADPARAPDRGPREVHPSAGATAVGARDFLIAFNVNLETDDVELARRIARAVRERDGGLPGVRALGWLLPEAGVVQVSMNLCDWRRTSIEQAFDEVEQLASEVGASVRESELVGLAPRAALDEAVARRVRLAGFDPALHTIEGRLGIPAGPPE